MSVSLGGPMLNRYAGYIRSSLAPEAMIKSITLDGSLVPLGSTATHEPTVIARDLWARWKSLDTTKKLYKMIGMNI